MPIGHRLESVESTRPFSLNELYVEANRDSVGTDRDSVETNRDRESDSEPVYCCHKSAMNKLWRCR